MFLRNVWQVAAGDEEVIHTLRAATILGDRVVLDRTTNVYPVDIDI